MKRTLLAAIALAIAVPCVAADRIKTANGVVEGVTEASGIHVYRGIPFAAPPVGDLRWKAPQPVQNWTDVRSAAQFGPRCMQASMFGDMVFRSNGMSEDCLYLNVWTPAKSANERLPVLVYFFGGGFVAGDGSESRYDGESMAKKGIVSLTVNYRLGVFGFMAHPELTKESPHHASGSPTAAFSMPSLESTCAPRMVPSSSTSSSTEYRDATPARLAPASTSGTRTASR